MLLKLNNMLLAFEFMVHLHNAKVQKWLEVVTALDDVTSRSMGDRLCHQRQCKVKVSNLIFCFHQTRTIPPSLVKPFGNSTW